MCAWGLRDSGADDEDEEDEDATAVEQAGLIDDEAEESDEEEVKKPTKETTETEGSLKNPKEVFLGVLPAAVDFQFKDSQCRFTLEVCDYSLLLFFKNLSRTSSE